MFVDFLKTKLSKTKLSIVTLLILIMVLIVLTINIFKTEFNFLQFNTSEETIESSSSISQSAVFITLNRTQIVAGSGTYVTWENEPALLTAHHMFNGVTTDLENFQICSLSYGGGSRECVTLTNTVLYSSEEYDIIVVSLSEPFRTIQPQVPYRNYSFTTDEEIYVISSPNGLAIHMILHGRIASISVPFGDGLVIADLPVWFGSSGSGVYNSKGELVAVLSGMLQSTTRGHSGIPIGNFSLIYPIP